MARKKRGINLRVKGIKKASMPGISSMKIKGFGAMKRVKKIPNAPEG